MDSKIQMILIRENLFCFLQTYQTPLSSRVRLLQSRYSTTEEDANCNISAGQTLITAYMICSPLETKTAWTAIWSTVNERRNSLASWHDLASVAKRRGKLSSGQHQVGPQNSFPGFRTERYCLWREYPTLSEV